MSSITSLEFTNNCFFLASGYQNGEMKVWDVKKKTVEYRSTKKCIEVPCLSWSSNNSLLAFGTSVGEIEVVDFKQRATIASYARKNYDGIRAIKFAPGSRNTICAGCKDGSVGVYSLQQPDLISRYWKLHTNKVTDIAFAESQEDLVISCSLDEKISVLDIRQKKIANTIDMEEGLTCLAIAPNGYNMVVGCYYGKIKAVDMRKSDTAMMTYKGHKTIVKSIDYSKVVKPAKRADSSFTTTNKSRADITVRTSDNKDASIYNKPVKEDRYDLQSLNNKHGAVTDLRHANHSMSVESRIIPDLSHKTHAFETKINGTVASKLNEMPNSMSQQDKDEIKCFIRSEVNSLRLDIIREFGMQLQEIKAMMQEQKHARNN